MPVLPEGLLLAAFSALDFGFCEATLGSFKWLQGLLRHTKNIQIVLLLELQTQCFNVTVHILVYYARDFYHSVYTVHNHMILFNRPINSDLV